MTFNHLPPRSSAPSEPVFLSFSDNRLLPLLFGEYDSHLSQIEQALGVTLIHRGNQVVFRGPDAVVAQAKQVLQQLYKQLETGNMVDTAEVDTALRMAADGRDLFGRRDLTVKTPKKRVNPRSSAQADYIRAMLDHDLTLAIGPAGTGKTWLAVCLGVAQLVEGHVDRLILSRPAVEAGERLGFLPGDMREKVDPYLRPVYDALYDMLPAERVKRHLEEGMIEIAPLAFMRGRTLSNAFVLLDEAQNTTPMQMKMFLTRLGENSRMVVTGDLTQVDLPSGQVSGLRHAAGILKGVEGITIVRFTEADVIRHPLVTRIVGAYERSEQEG